MPGFIRRRSQGSWEVTVELGRDPATGKRRRRTQTVKGTKRQAEAVQAALLHELETGIDIDSSRLTVGDFLERWLKAVKPNLAPATLLRYSGLINGQLIPGIGALPLAKLRPLHVQALYTELRERGRKDGRPLSPQTLVHVHRVLSEALAQAVRWQMLPRNVCDAVEAPRVRAREMRFLTPDEARRLLAASDPSQGSFEAVVAFALHTGLRQGELFGLRWENVDLDAGTLAVRTALQRLPGVPFTFREPKTARGRRVVSLGAAAVEILRVQRKRQREERLAAGPAWQDHDLVFTTAVGTPCDASNIRRTFWRLLEQASLPRLRFHDLRHTHASLMLARGIHPKVVSERLGHSSIGLTLDTYSHVMPNLQQEAVQEFDRWLTRPDDQPRANER
jgi:integrase